MPPFDKAEVRKALNMAINKQALIKALFQDAGATPADNLIPPTMWSWNKDVKSDAYDPEAAKKVLADAGVTRTSELWACRSRPSLQPELPARRRTDPGRLGQGRRQGRTSSATSGPKYRERRQEEGSPRRLPDRLDRRQWRSGQLLRHAVRLLGHRRVELLELVQQGLRGPDPEGQDDHRPGRAHQALRSRRRWSSSEAGSGAASSPTPRSMHADEQERLAASSMDPLGIHRFDGVDVAE